MGRFVGHRCSTAALPRLDTPHPNPSPEGEGLYEIAMTQLRPFHLAIPVNDLAAARGFYGGVMGCPEGRSSDEWVDFEFFGHQLVVHQTECRDDSPTPNPSESLEPSPSAGASGGREGSNPVDGHDVPVPHFGVVLTVDQFEVLAGRISAAGVAFVHPPMVRFAGLPGEQRTMFLRDPAGNALEFKAFADDGMLFAR